MKLAKNLTVILSLLLGCAPAHVTAQIVGSAKPLGQEAASPSPERMQHRVGVDESNPLTMSLFDAVKQALQNNREIEVERINVQQAGYDLFSARGARDVTLGAASFYEHRVTPSGSVLSGGLNGTVTTRSANWDLNAQQLLPTGAQWTAQFTNLRSDTNSIFNSLNPQFNSVLNFQIRQPLMRGFSLDDARRRIRVANRRLDLSDSQFRQKAIEIVSRVQRAYWDLLFGLREVQIQRESVLLTAGWIFPTASSVRRQSRLSREFNARIGICCLACARCRFSAKPSALLARNANETAEWWIKARWRRSSLFRLMWNWRDAGKTSWSRWRWSRVLRTS